MNKDHNPSENKGINNPRTSFSDLVISQILESSKGSDVGGDEDEGAFSEHKDEHDVGAAATATTSAKADGDGNAMRPAMPYAQFAGRQTTQMLKRQRAEQKCGRAAGSKDYKGVSCHDCLER